MAHIRKRHSRPGLGGTTAGAKALVLPTVAGRVLEELVAYGLATARHIRVGGGRWLASMVSP